MDLAGKVSTASGPPAETESRQPPLSSGRVAAPEPVAVNVAVNMSIESSLGEKVATQDGGGGSSGVVGSGSGDLVMLTAGSGSGSGSASHKKRGRPRKYDAEGNLRIPYTATGTGSPRPAFTLTSPTFAHSRHSSSSKRGRGRPPGSGGNWQVLASLGELFANTAGGDFTPHVVNVYTGEDVAGKILTFSQKGPRGMCVLSANGTISNVTIRQPGSSGGLLTYEGRFEILSLTGSFTTSENGGIRCRTGGLSVSLAGPDGRVIGGGVAGLLLAASPIQIVVGSFVPNSYKTNKRRANPEPRTGGVAHGIPDVVTEARPVSQASQQGHIFLTPTSDLPAAANGEADNSTSTKDNTHSTSNEVADYSSSGPGAYQRETPDINVCVSFE